jgi:N-acetylglucosaminyl-diphospho-decaprenol L-rhamnosyltransferase
MTTVAQSATEKAPPYLQVVIVSYRCCELLGKCLETLEAYPATRGPMAVAVVDNDSADGTVEMVRNRFPGVQLHPMSENVGFSRANNVVIRDSAARYCLLLNPDTELKPGALDKLLDKLEADKRIGMLGPRLVRQDGSLDHASKRGFPTVVSSLGHFSGLGRRRKAGRMSAYRATDLEETAIGDVDAVNGAFMLVRSEAIEDVGLLDEGYWLYMEDLDWCYRFHQRGWRVVYDGTTTVVHVKGATSGKYRRMRQNVSFHQGMARFYRKHYAGRRPLLDATVYAGIAAKLAFSVGRNALARRLASP